MKRNILRGVLFLSVAVAAAILIYVLAAEAHQRTLQFATQVAAGAQKLFNSGQREQAIETLQDLVAQLPDSVIAQRELAMELAAAGDPRAATQLRRVLRLSPGDAAAAMKLSEVLVLSGDLEGAAAAARTACTIEPTNALHWTALSALLLRAGDPDGALSAAQRAVRFGEGVPDAHLALGFARQRMGDSEGARDAFSTALKLDPGNGAAASALGAIHVSPRRPPRPRTSA